MKKDISAKLECWSADNGGVVMLTDVRRGVSLPQALVVSQPTVETALIRRPPAELARRERVQALLIHANEEDLPISYVGMMPLFSGYRVYPGRTYDWILVNLAQDPLFHDRDGFPVPGRILEKLRAMEEAGIDFDALYIAQETEKGKIREGEPLTTEALLPPPPKAVVQVSHQLGRASEALWAVAAAPLVVSLVAGAAVGAGALMVAPALATAAASCVTLDHILLGTTVAPGRPVRAGEPACWFYLAHWAYGEEI